MEILTYENAIIWIENNTDKSDYDNYEAWYEASQEKINTPELFESEEFNRMMEDSWINEMGLEDFEAPSVIPTGQTELPANISHTIRSQDVPARIFSRTPIRITKFTEEQRVLPPTQRAPIVIPAVILPNVLPIQQKISILQRIRNLFKRK